MGDELDGSATRLQRVMTRARRDVTPQHTLTVDFRVVSTAPQRSISLCTLFMSLAYLVLRSCLPLVCILACCCD
jgi:hypothetical protein